MAKRKVAPQATSSNGVVVSLHWRQTTGCRPGSHFSSPHLAAVSSLVAGSDTPNKQALRASCASPRTAIHGHGLAHLFWPLGNRPPKMALTVPLTPEPSTLSDHALDQTSNRGLAAITLALSSRHSIRQMGWGATGPSSSNTLQKHYWENFTPLLTPEDETVGAGTQSFKKHAPVPTLGSKFQA